MPKTEIITIHDVNESDADIRRAAACIRGGGLVVFPTETVYGLGADGTSDLAAKKIYAAKGRPSDNPLILHIASPGDAEPYAETCALYDRLAEAFMPGPLTVILPAKPTVPPSTRGGLETVALRCPDHPIAHRLIHYAGCPIAAPSANLSGSPSPTNVAHVIDDMEGRVDIILDGGASEFGLESTIVKVDGADSLTLLRPGKITIEQLRTVCKTVVISDAVAQQLKEGDPVLSPGMKYRHYAPKAPVYLLDGDADAAIRHIGAFEKKNVAVIWYGDELSRFAELLPHCTPYGFGTRGDMLTQAHTLFFLLREADKGNYDAIFAPLPERAGIGLALYNRMIRAAAHRIIRLN